MPSSFDPASALRTKPCTFRLEGVDAASVAVLGTFNDWSTTRNLMKRINGKWEAEVVLPPGRHSYCFFAIETDRALRGSLLHIGSTIDVAMPTAGNAERAKSQFLNLGA